MSTRAWYEKALQDGREAYRKGKGRDDVPKRRRSSEGRFFWQCGWEEESAVKRALEQECELENMIATVRIEKRSDDPEEEE